MPGKKKGQASVKKAPKRGRGGGASGSRPAKKKAKKAAQPDEGANSANEADLNDGDSDDNEESDNGPYCICRGPDDHRFMIGCDLCDEWYHGECIGIEKEVGELLIERFVCSSCTKEEEGVATVYKKTCSYQKCKKPARLYDDRPKEERSHFCSAEHAQLWWERGISSLPKKTGTGGAKVPVTLTQQQMVAILEGGILSPSTAKHTSGEATNGEATNTNRRNNIVKRQTRTKMDPEDGKLSRHCPQKSTCLPFAEFEDDVENYSDMEMECDGDESERDDRPPDWFLNLEQKAMIAASEARREEMAHDSIEHQKMMDVVEWASIRRKALIADKQLDDSACGYDSRLDTVGALQPFVQWLDSADGHALFDGTDRGQGAKGLGPNIPLVVDPKYTCDKKRCKTHHGWYATHMRDLKMHVKLVRIEIRELVEREIEIRTSALRGAKKLEKTPSRL